MTIKWAPSGLDRYSHAVAPLAHHPVDVLTAQCGHPLGVAAPFYDDPWPRNWLTLAGSRRGRHTRRCRRAWLVLDWHSHAIDEATSAPGGRPGTHQPPKVAPTMPTAPAHPASDPLRDAEGTPIALQSRVEQVTVDKEYGALPCRLHQTGRVTGLCTTLVYVLFDHENQLIALPPHVLRVLDTSDGC